MKISTLICFSAISASFHVHAGLTAGVEAFNKHRYGDARRELNELAAQGDPEAMAVMGEMLSRGLGGARDELKAREYILQAREKDSTRAIYVLGRMYLNGNMIGKDEAKGIELIKEAAAKAYPPAQSLLGSWIANGTFGLEKNEAVALTWFQQAVEQKDPLAMVWLGSFYEGGKAGLPQDQLIALDWYKKAGELRDVTGMISAGRMYALGTGVSADGNEALRWFRMAASPGNYRAYTWIANVYEFGRGGVARSPVLAYAWYFAVPSNAGGNEVKLASEGKDRLAKTMSQSEQDTAAKESQMIVRNAQLAAITENAASIAASMASRTGVYGSGVVVSVAGDVVTNEHVVQNCAKVRIQPVGSHAKIIARDAKNDLALLRLDGDKPLPAIKVRTGKSIRLGEDLTTIGYPLRGVLSSGPVVTTGIVNALSGFNDDTSAFQMSATVQPGSSGGPVVDRNGLLVGIVRQRLLPAAPGNPQNVNFGINLATVLGFLNAHKVDYDSGAPQSKSMNIADITAHVRKSTVQIECY